MSKKRVVLASASAMVAAVGLAVSIAPPSHASTAQASHASTAETDCVSVSYVLCLYGPPPEDTYFGELPCTVRTWQYGGLLGYVINYCLTRVWLHQNNNGTGWTLCINPETAEYADYNDAIANVQITSNTSNC